MKFSIPATATVSSPPATSSAAVAHHRLAEAAQQFEGMLLQELLKPLREHGFCQGDDQQTREKSGDDTMSSFGTEAMATAIAKAGGLGIAKQVVAQVEGERIAHEKGTAKDRECWGSQNK